MTKYDKELQTGTEEYEEATKPLRNEEAKDGRRDRDESSGKREEEDDTRAE